MWVLRVKCVGAVEIVQKGNWVVKERNQAAKRVKKEGFWWHKVD